MSDPIIEPTVGRIVLFRPQGEAGATLAAIVTAVQDVRDINIHVFPALAHESSHTIENVQLMQQGDVIPDGPFAEWMPYQKGQAAKTEAAEQPIHAKIEDLATHLEDKIQKIGELAIAAVRDLEQKVLGGRAAGATDPAAVSAKANEPKAAAASGAETLTGRLANHTVAAAAPEAQAADQTAAVALPPAAAAAPGDPIAPAAGT